MLDRTLLLEALALALAPALALASTLVSAHFSCIYEKGQALEPLNRTLGDSNSSSEE